MCSGTPFRLWRKLRLEAEQDVVGRPLLPIYVIGGREFLQVSVPVSSFTYHVSIIDGKKRICMTIVNAQGILLKEV